MPNLLKLFVYQEVRNGADPAFVAAVLGLTEEWVREHVEAARLCFERQVEVRS
jgi:hypothetical protein